MSHELLVDAAVEHLSAWPSAKENGRRNGDAAVIDSATMLSYIRPVEAGRAHAAIFDRYRECRRRWPPLIATPTPPAARTCSPRSCNLSPARRR
ncbi:hypothetical protein O7634_29935 [Micromonospora sp. WMMD1120]|uniref:hypothetical protein n=1 Tax=Micromonospora sp. WMMD1120 TaxID=3016106 RepID=UPI002417B35C|nr:hypothetical protein [Micromonospora sp. WMMD1120]MDG4811000.1 hypothetical protein [Micromonospora sp. WMMD1120]